MCLTTFFAIVEALLFLLNTYFLDMSKCVHVTPEINSIRVIISILFPDPWWLVFAKLPNSFTGSIMLTYTCVFTYAMKETYTRNRTLRLNILESAIIFPSPIAYMSSSFLSETHPWIVPGQTLNYIGVFFVSLCSYSIAFLCSIVFLKPVNVVNDPQPVLQSKRLSICS